MRSPVSNCSQLTADDVKTLCSHGTVVSHLGFVRVLGLLHPGEGTPTAIPALVENVARDVMAVIDSAGAYPPCAARHVGGPLRHKKSGILDALTGHVCGVLARLSNEKESVVHQMPDVCGCNVDIQFSIVLAPPRLEWQAAAFIVVGVIVDKTPQMFGHAVNMFYVMSPATLATNPCIIGVHIDLNTDGRVQAIDVLGFCLLHSVTGAGHDIRSSWKVCMMPLARWDWMECTAQTLGLVLHAVQECCASGGWPCNPTIATGAPQRVAKFGDLVYKAYDLNEVVIIAYYDYVLLNDC